MSSPSGTVIKKTWINRPFSLVYFFSQYTHVQILRGFAPFFCSLNRVHAGIFMLACALFNEQNKGPILLSIITWFALGKQNAQAKKVYLLKKLTNSTLPSNSLPKYQRTGLLSSTQWCSKEKYSKKNPYSLQTYWNLSIYTFQLMSSTRHEKWCH